MSLSKTESVPIHSNLYSRHSQSSLTALCTKMADTHSSYNIQIIAGSKAEGLPCNFESDWDVLNVLKAVLLSSTGPSSPGTIKGILHVDRMGCQTPSLAFTIHRAYLTPITEDTTGRHRQNKDGDRDAISGGGEKQNRTVAQRVRISGDREVTGSIPTVGAFF
ncbi:hypothetical protein DPMN_039489 [Dreissena polymorpha]|uniref:Uncharacterized protein n=1 Tax=Dreissena polymorpha TaxID=45954 RepID=A0A9D4CU83_DREPO|nr:hypothetical protein DPMN_039489 [Dreissena polymorpha]